MGWSTDAASGLVLVDGAPIRLQGAEEADFAKKLAPLRALFEEKAALHGIPWHWLAGQGWRESRFRAGILGHDPGGSTGVGLFQITSKNLKAGHTDQELTDPELNTDIAAGFLARLAKGGNELPAVASMFNAGMLAGSTPGTFRPRPSSSCTKVTIVDGKPVGQQVPGNKWGFAQACGHIEAVVRGSNSAILLDGVSPPKAGDGSGAGLLAACGLALALKVLS